MFYLDAPLADMSGKDLGVAKEEAKEEAEEDGESVGSEDDDESSGYELATKCGPAGYEDKGVEEVSEEVALNAVLTPSGEPSS